MRRSGKHSKWIMVLDIVLVICLAAAGVLYTKAEHEKKRAWRRFIGRMCRGERSGRKRDRSACTQPPGENKGQESWER